MAPIRTNPRRSRTGVIVSFAVVVLGLAVVDALVLLAVEPQLQSLRDIANNHARAVQVTTRIRAQISTARRDLFTAVSDRGRGERHGRVDVAAEFARVAAHADALLPLVDTPAELADIAALRTSLERCAEEAERIQTLLAGGDHLEVRHRWETFVELTRLANETADQIVTFNTGKVEQLSRSIRLNLRWTVLAATIVTLVGGASALVLLRRALRGLASEEAAANARSTELEAFAARAAHELRTPLQTVSLALRTLEQGSNPQALERARRSAERLRDTVDDLLAFAHAGGSALEPGAADLSRVVSEVREEFGPQLASAHVSLRVDVPSGTMVAMATTHLATVMRNLVANAVKYANADDARVVVRATRANDAVHVEVADNGPGIPAEALPRVFEPFVRGTSRSTGHGLGLATVRRLVEAHRGAVHMSSAPGGGTTVELDLPRAWGDSSGGRR